LKILLLTLAVLLPAIVFCLSKLVDRYRKPGGETASLVIMIKDQEPWVEGFMRKLFCLTRGTPDLEIQVVDDGSSDLTREVLARLQRVYPFGLSHELNDMAGRWNSAGGYVFDVRGLNGSNLLNAPVFSQLKAFSAGKSSVLSK
jgi:hypothetical protein